MRLSSWNTVTTPAACASSGERTRKRLAEERDLAGIGPDRAGEHLHERALPGAVLSDQRVHLAALAGQTGAGERLDTSERLLDP